MKDNRSVKVKDICSANIGTGCSKVCPLAEACKSKPGDTKAAFDIRINEAAEKLEGESVG